MAVDADKRVLIPASIPERIHLERILRDQGWQPCVYNSDEDAENAISGPPASALLLTTAENQPKRLHLIKKIRRTWPQTLLVGMGESPDPAETDTTLTRTSTPEVIATTVRMGQNLRRAQATQSALREQLDQLRQHMRQQHEQIGELESTCGELRSQAQSARELALRDDLTGLYNRRHFRHAASQELERANRERGRFAVAMIDLDHFKQQNDTHGHIVGDHVLREFAEALVGSLRHMDTVARYGGEEFIALLPQTRTAGEDTFDPVRLMERLRRRIEATPFCAVEAQPPIRLTFSAGIVTYPEHGAGIDKLIAAADALLYQAKAGGRNRICTA